MKKYTCPHCKQVQKTVIEWNTASIGYEMTLDHKHTLTDMKIADGMDVECYACPLCGFNLKDVV